MDQLKERNVGNEIEFDTSRLPYLYQFKEETIDLCLRFLKSVVKSSAQSKSRTLVQKLNEIKNDLYDIFCRWYFNAIQQRELDPVYFLPTGPFIMKVDLEYFLHRFNLSLSDSFEEFPVGEFEAIRNRAKRNDVSLSKFTKKEPFVSDIQKKRLIDMYASGNDFARDMSRLLSRYYYLGGLNNSLSIPIHVLMQYQSHELFGTPFNTCSKTFCSPFRDEALFGSSGSFFDFRDYDRCPTSSIVYFANPPFDDTFCNHMSDKLLVDLEEGLFSLIVIIPVWDNKQQQKHKLKDFGLPFLSYQKLVKSPFFIREEFLDKDIYPFFNYFYQKNVYISDTHLINLGRPVDLDALMASWRSI